MSGYPALGKQRSQDMKSILHAIVLAAALMLQPAMAYAAETITVYKDAS
jgi:hypothetical protein